MKSALMFASAITLGACGAHQTYYAGGSAQWERLGASKAQFATDNEGCGASAAEDRAYRDCMYGRGWRVVQR